MIESGQKWVFVTENAVARSMQINTHINTVLVSIPLFLYESIWFVRMSAPGLMRA